MYKSQQLLHYTPPSNDKCICFIRGLFTLRLQITKQAAINFAFQFHNLISVIQKSYNFREVSICNTSLTQHHMIVVHIMFLDFRQVCCKELVHKV